MIVVLDVSPDARGSLGPDVETVSSLGELLSSISRAPGPWTVVLGPEVAVDDAVSLATRYRATRPEVGVVLQRIEVDSAVLTEALRAGANPGRIVAADINADALLVAQRRRSVAFPDGDGRVEVAVDAGGPLGAGLVILGHA